MTVGYRFGPQGRSWFVPFDYRSGHPEPRRGVDPPGTHGRLRNCSCTRVLLRQKDQWLTRKLLTGRHTPAMAELASTWGVAAVGILPALSLLIGATLGLNAGLDALIYACAALLAAAGALWPAGGGCIERGSSARRWHWGSWPRGLRWPQTRANARCTRPFVTC